jgi:hypothetical protein
VLAEDVAEPMLGIPRSKQSVLMTARQLEARLLKSATSFAEYSDDSTWRSRLNKLTAADVGTSASLDAYS